jgi:hypothetical protein
MVMVKSVQEYNGRFLQRTTDDGGWRVLDDSSAREKTASAFRSRIKSTAGVGSKVASSGMDDSQPDDHAAKRIQLDNKNQR